jgi:hypothetical protein
MHSELLNLWLCLKLLSRVSVLCGFMVSVLLVYVAETWASAFRVPARKLFGKVVSDEVVRVGISASVLDRNSRRLLGSKNATRQKKICRRVGTHPIGAKFGDARP